MAAPQKEVIAIPRPYLDKDVQAFIAKNVSAARNVTYATAMILLVLAAASYGNTSINAKALQPNADTVFYRIDTTIRKLEDQLWAQGLQFLRERRKKLARVKCYMVVDETHEPYFGKLFKKAKRGTLTPRDRQRLRYLHRYKPAKGCTGSYKYLVFALVYGNRRRVLRIRMLRRRERYKAFIVQTLTEIRNELRYACALLDRGFYDGRFIEQLRSNGIPFIVRARISKKMKREYGFSSVWKCYRDFEIGKEKAKGDLVLGTAQKQKWAFITNLELEDWREIRELYRKRWNIENIFKATDGIQLRMETSNPTMKLFGACLSFLLYNAWQRRNRRRELPLLDFVRQLLERIFARIAKTIQRYRDKLRLNIPFWDRIAASPC